MSYWLETELQRYFGLTAGPPPLSQPPDLSSHQLELQTATNSALADDPVLAFMLRLDSILGVHRGVVTCLATVRRNVHHYELVYLQRFKQIAEPAIRHPKSRKQSVICLDPKALRCGQRVLLKVHTRSGPTEPLQLLRECSVLQASWGRDPALFPRAYLFGCLGNSCWRVASSDRSDDRQLVMHKQHFLLCQYVEDSLQRMIDVNRSSGQCLQAGAATRLCNEMLSRLRHLHCLGWTHGDLRPACFLQVGSCEELLLGDFASASPIAQDCLTFDGGDSGIGGDGGGGGAYRSVRHRGRLSSVLSDLESLVYIVCSLASPSPLPWESVEAANVDAAKLAVWKFAESDAASVEAGSLWQDWRMEALFNCDRLAVGEHPAYRLALAISQLDTSCGIEPSAVYSALFDALR